MPSKQPTAKNHTALKKLIETTTPDNLQKALLAALPNSTDEQLQALSSMLLPVTKEASTQKHCVRCHNAFFDTQNHPKACTIMHGQFDGERASVGSDRCVATFFCCDLQFDPEQDDYEGEPCIEEAHTTDPNDVDYYDGDQGEGNENVVTCGEKGCSKAKRKAASTKDGKRITKKKK